MSLWQSIKKIFAGSEAAIKPPPPNVEPDDDEVVVPEMNTNEVQAALSADRPPFLLDVREQYEWDQVHIPGALHIPMNSVPEHLEEFPREGTIVVVCAYGSRSYSVAHFLRAQGFDARNLVGGITQWRIQGGQVRVGKPQG